jgi:hypothetical protein
MNYRLALLTTLAVGAIAAPAAQAQTIPDYYVGVGVRAGFNDSTSFVLDSKAKVFDFDNIAGGTIGSVSVRPAVIFDSDTELRLPVSVDFILAENFYPYAGAGIAYNADGRSAVDAMITGGLDWSVARNIVLDLNASVLFKPGDTDTELTATINYAF